VVQSYKALLMVSGIVFAQLPVLERLSLVYTELFTAVAQSRFRSNFCIRNFVSVDIRVYLPK
jgi:hypothetical protein